MQQKSINIIFLLSHYNLSYYYSFLNTSLFFFTIIHLAFYIAMIATTNTIIFILL